MFPPSPDASAARCADSLVLSQPPCADSAFPLPSPCCSQKYKEGKFIVEKSRVVEGEAL